MKKFMVIKYNGNVPLFVWDNLSQKTAIELAEEKNHSSQGWDHYEVKPQEEEE